MFTRACCCLRLHTRVCLSERREEAKALALQEDRTEAEERQNQEMLQAVAEGRVAATVK